VLSMVVSLGVASCASTSGQAVPARPNIVFVLTDDLATNLVQYMPHVRALASAGTSFTNYTVTDSLCCPSRSSIFSGKFPHDTGVFTNTGKDGGFNVFHSRGEETDTVATALQHAGYHTAMMGKYLNGYQPAAKLGGNQPYVPPGWNEWDVAGNGYPEFNYALNQNHQVQHYGEKPADYLTNVLGGKATNFINTQSAAHTPFFLEVATFAPHAPYTPAPQDAHSFQNVTAPKTPAYDTLPQNAPAWLTSRTALTPQDEQQIDTAFRKRVQDVQSVDRMIAGLQQTLTKDGVAGDTDVVFSSDNGYHMGEYRLLPGKQTAFDTDVNVPLIASGPGIKSGQTVSALAQNIDLAPTFETIGGATPPADVDGHTLTPLLAGQPSADWRTAALVEHHGPDTDPSDPDYPPKNSGNPPSYQALRTSTYTYVEYADGSKEYYDRTTDPSELDNIAGTLPASTLTALHNALHAMAACHGGTACWSAAHLTH
ncbi:MAG TPA: sulfatase, partial [Pseudonocardiaceae bacterium]